MEDNKYNNLILDLIREHRKYDYVKDIENSIVEDVYQRAKSILDSVDDKATLETYLKKVVSISIIAASKNTISNQTNNREVLEREVESTIDTQSYLSSEQNADNEEVNTFIIETEPVVESINTEEEMFFNHEDDLNGDISFLQEQDLSIDNKIENQDIQHNLNEDEKNIPQDDLLIDDNVNVDVVLPVEDDILPDTISEDALCSDASEIKEEPMLEATDVDIKDEINKEDGLLNINEGVTDVLESTEMVQLEDNDSADFMTTELSDKMINSIEESDYEGILEVQNLPESSDNKLDIDESKEELTFNEELPINDELLLEQEDSIVEQDFIQQENTLSEFLEETPVASEDLLDSSIISEESVPSDSNIETHEKVNNADFNVSINEDEIQDKLCELCNEYPSLPILDIFDLKYKKNLSIKELVEMLSLSEEIITDTLCKIIGIIEE